MSKPKSTLKKLIVDLTEKEFCTLSDKNEISEIKVDGLISVINPSEDCRIWNGDLSISKIENTNLGEGSIKVGEVQAQSEWSQPYSVLTEQPLLRLVETVDTCSTVKSIEPHWAFSHGEGTNLLFTIRLTNVSDSKISKVSLRKKFNEDFGKPDIELPELGKAVFHPKSREITWNGIDLLPNTEAELRIHAELKVTKVQKYDAGEIIVDYLVDEKNRSSIDVKINSLTNAMVGGTQEEDPRQPGKWICSTDLLNDSDFPLIISKLEATHILTSGEREIVVEEEPNIVIAPNDSYEKEYIVESPQPPEVENKINYSVIHEVRRKVVGQILKKAEMIPVIALEGVKMYNPGEVDAHDKTPMMTMLKAVNVGSSDINEINFVEILPPDFKPPQAEDIRVKINGQPLGEGVSIICEPGDDDPLREHQLTITVKDLDDNIGGLKPNGRVEVEYPIVAWNPKPQQEYVSPLTVTGNVLPPIYPSKTKVEPVKIDVRYVSRKISIYKTVQPGSVSGEFIIPLKFVNKGGVAVESITIQDFVPKGFKLETWDPEDLKPEQVPGEDGVYLIWTFPRIEKGNQVNIKYSIKGEGEYIRREPKQIVK
ncbi:MAG: hypothetical protein ACTSUV_01570 [Candidatus Ranarchaeia archaeon]